MFAMLAGPVVQTYKHGMNRLWILSPAAYPECGPIYDTQEPPEPELLETDDVSFSV